MIISGHEIALMQKIRKPKVGRGGATLLRSRKIGQSTTVRIGSFNLEAGIIGCAVRRVTRTNGAMFRRTPSGITSSVNPVIGHTKEQFMSSYGEG
jgi:hypothetical protein